MKKKIVSFISALVLTCAMGLNVCAAGSVTAADVAAAAGEVTVPATEAELTESKAVADSIIVFDESVSGLTTTTLDVADVLPLAEEMAALNGQEDIASVEVLAVVELNSTAAGKVVVKMSVGANETAVALHSIASGVERIIGEVSGDTVTFEFSSFSPVAIIKVTKAHNSSSSNTTTTTTTTATTAAATADTAAALAPTTGDMSMMVTVMAVIFMAGAAISVWMAKKRA